MRASALAKTPLQMAVRANALCMVVRSQDWTPIDGDIIEGCNIKPESPEEDCKTSAEAPGSEKNTQVEVRSIPEASVSADAENSIEIQDNSTESTNLNIEQKVLLEVRAPYAHYAPKTILGKIGSFMLQSYRFRAMPLHHQLVYTDDVQLHGLCQLPPGYTLCFVPPHMSVRPRRNPNGEQTSSLTISSHFSALQVLWSITQTGIGSYTLYKSRGSQLDIYGYAAFGLTVIPYVIASVINLLASLRKKEKKDPSRHILTIPSHGPFTRLPSTHSEPLFLFLATTLLIAAVAAPYIIIYILTGWKKRQATSNQTTFTLHWLSVPVW
ncbi:pogo transposable element protein [Rutstroemia sp. NJR-2017a BBW]|nr:pogo transposable element protein [Rutstroemia sp. NJR-2017a BBW]